MRRKLNQGKRPRIAVDPWDRDMTVEDAKALNIRLKIQYVVYSKLPPTNRCCNYCCMVLYNTDKIRGKDSNGLDCVVYVCSRCGLIHRL